MGGDENDSVTEREWFSTGEPSSGPGAEFLRTLRAAAMEWSFNDLTPDATQLDGLSAEIAVPGLTCNVKFLRVAFNPTGRDEPTLRGEWADGDWFDGPLGLANDLVVNGIDAPPAQYARWAAEWLRGQLSRSIVRQEWDEQPTSFFGPRPGVPRVASRRWVFGDGEDVLDQNGSWFGRSLFKRPPDRVVTERPATVNP